MGGGGQLPFLFFKERADKATAILISIS